MVHTATLNTWILHLRAAPRKQTKSMLNLFDESKDKYDVLSIRGVKERVRKADTLEELRRIHEQFISWIQALQDSCLPTGEIYTHLNEAHDEITRKAVSFAYLHIAGEIGEPEGDFCFFSMGSSARQEQTIWTDQDNGLIYDFGMDQVKAERFAREFSQAAVHYLSEAGYPLCPGNVMASNLRWRHSESEWKTQLASYWNEAGEHDLKYLMMLLDTRPIFGNPGLLYQLRSWYLNELRQYPKIIVKMSSLAGSHDIPINFAGMIFTERWGKFAGRFDLKQGVFAPFTNTVKVLAAISQVEESSTRERLIALEERGELSPRQLEDCLLAYDFLLHLRLCHSVGARENDDKLDYHILLNRLESTEATKLKDAMRLAKRLQKKLKKRGIRFEQSTGI
ncbi:DUF294 nucleotidyltransferase-like domain-containing protein [Fictibacillus fluitans]|uniref:DUF294 nucleotidyltransferase-like domain-containing protein n=1 Tax=Fictibacillus fluitans TaxID=3058422 RepID=A0ABT8HSF6_9BACL|nr:DUF294 nucleotidyltransferase-like domain-containing protein [Fictibacillus sp. NE201]MDN4523217.1 DUF294 nucleotidyltransferase-like domain-containing protein [Fictibacillus sp. NE201]